MISFIDNRPKIQIAVDREKAGTYTLLLKPARFNSVNENAPPAEKKDMGLFLRLKGKEIPRSFPLARQILVLGLVLAGTPAFPSAAELLYRPDRKLLTRAPARHHAQLAEQLNYMERVYGRLPQNILKGKPVIIFLEPAHGLYKSGRSSARATGRVGSRNLTEEYYSLKIARRLYRRFQKNPNFKVETTPSLLAAIQGKRKTYKDISFRESIRTAKKLGAALIVTEHLNNVSLGRRPNYTYKLGIQLAKDRRGNRTLVHNKKYPRGFLTLYNPNDALGISSAIAIKTKKLLSAKNYVHDKWGAGIVPDRRFAFFNEFPASIIFESGFICSPPDEKILYSAKGQEDFARSHYISIVHAFSKFTGINLFHKKIKKGKFSRKFLRSYRAKIQTAKATQAGLYLSRRGEVTESIKMLRIPVASSALRGPDRKNVYKLYRDLKTIASGIGKFFNEGGLEKNTSLNQLIRKRSIVRKVIRRANYYALSRVRSISRRRLKRVQKKINARVAAKKKPGGSKPALSTAAKELRAKNRKGYLFVVWKKNQFYKPLRRTFGKRSAAWNKKILKTIRRKQWNFPRGIYLLYFDHRDTTNPRLRKIKKRTYVTLYKNSYYSDWLYGQTGL